MKRLSKAFLAVCLLILGSSNCYSQANPHELFLAKPTTQVFLNKIILEDTLNGQRKDLERVYVLERGGVWFINTSIPNPKWPINIKAGPGSGPKPVIYCVKNSSTNTFPTRVFSVSGNINIKNIVINGYMDLDPPSLAGGIAGQVFYVATAGPDIVLDSCIIMNCSGAVVQTPSAARIIKLTNCTFANIGQVGHSDIGNGRVVDIRTSSCDTLLLVNNTVINVFDRVVRHLKSTGPLNNFFFDHNTVINVGGMHGLMSVGQVQNKVSIKNNLFIDQFTAGSDTDYTRRDFEESSEYHPLNSLYAQMTWIYSSPDSISALAKWELKNNYYQVTDKLQAWFSPIMKADNAFRGMEDPILTNFIIKQAGEQTKTAFTKDVISIKNCPAPMTDIFSWYRAPLAAGGGGKTIVKSGGPGWILDYDRRLTQYFIDTLNCTYSTSSKAYTGAEQGLPAGDLNWYPAKKAQWLNSIREISHIPAEFSLEQNYPNPFNPKTQINFSLPNNMKVTLEVFDAIGRKVSTLINEVKHAGSYSVDFDASKLSSGVYFYRLTTPTQTVAKKMLLMK